MAEILVVTPGYQADFYPQAASAGDTFQNTGETILYFKNSGGSSIDVTIAPDPIGSLSFVPVVVAVAAGQEKVVGVFPAELFNSEGGMISLSYSSASGLSVGAMHLGRSRKGRPILLLPWTGTTWAIDGAGRAYNTPTMGSELLTDGGLENWTTSNDLTSWTELASGASVVSQETTIVNGGSNAARLTIDGASSLVGITQPNILAVGSWILLTSYARLLSGTPTYRMDTAGFVGLPRSLTATFTQLFQVARTPSSGGTYGFLRNSGASQSLVVDDCSARQLIFPTTIATCDAGVSKQTVAAQIHTLTTGILSGLIALLDSEIVPANFLIATHDGVFVRLDKCVAGTYTSLISTAAAFSSNAQIEIRRPSGNVFQLWYDGVQRGADQTVNDAGIINNTKYGLFSTYNSNTFSKFLLDGYIVPFGFPGA